MTVLTIDKLRRAAAILTANEQTEAERAVADIAAGAYNPFGRLRLIATEWDGVFRLDGGEFGLGSFVALPPDLAQAAMEDIKP